MSFRLPIFFFIYRIGVVLFLLGVGSYEGWAALGPLPRYASLRSKEVNIHVGPGSDFPIEWKFQRQGMPIEIINEFDTWRQIRDIEGTTGWVHKSLLVGKRHAIILRTKQPLSQTAQPQALQQAAKTDAQVVAYLEPGVIAKLKQCKSDWCRLEVKGYEGWIERKNIWGTYPHEEKF